MSKKKKKRKQRESGNAQPNKKVAFALDVIFEIKDHGDVTALAKKLRIHRDTVQKYVENRCSLIRMEHLSKLCELAVREYNVDPATLPGALFKYLPDEIWPMLAERESVEISMGIRTGQSFKDPLVALADSVLKDSITDGMNARTKHSRSGQPHYVLAPERKKASADDTLKQVAKIYATFHRKKKDKALVCIGSMKSNPLIEHLFVGYLKGAKRFQSEDNFDAPKQRSSPVYFLYREQDPHPSSAWGGLRLSQDDPGQGPGIYYENEDGEWICCPCNDDEDAALVFYRHCEAAGELEMILGGYSSYSSHALAWLLNSNDVCRLWEPVYSHRGVDIGLYVVRFERSDEDSSSYPHPLPPKNHEVIGLGINAIANRLSGTPAKTTVKS